jgi:glucose/arabinose dehydrogenase
MMIKPCLGLLAGCLALGGAAAAQVTTKRLTTGVSRPLWAGAPRGDARIFIGVKGGRIRILKNGALLTTPFLDIGTQVSSSSEQGLLGVAFHPDYASNGYFYVNYTDNGGDTVVSRFSVSADPDLADPGSESVILTQAQPFDNHNGGDLHFGPDGYLYVFFGDGGSANDPSCNAQDLGTWLGKILRIDVDAGAPYGIPPDNPFVGVPGALPEIYHLGLRNPWRNSFDRLTGDLYIGDVGQDLREEISFAPAGVGGLNFGWKVMEGTRCAGMGGCPPLPPCNDPAYELPITELLHANGSFAITGGYVYRGCAIPSEQGRYFFSDFADARIRSLEYDPLTGTISNLQDRTAELAPGSGLSIVTIASFGEDGFGELLIVDHSAMNNGEVYKMVPAGSPGASAAVRNGGGTNASCYSSTSLPVLGNAWTVAVDASAHPGATLSFVVAYGAPASGTLIGAGEILLDLAGTKLFALARPSSGLVDDFRVAIPCDSALVGMTAYTQALILGGAPQLCNAVDATVGYY